MITEQGLRLATAEDVSAHGSVLPTISEDSSDATTGLNLDPSGFTEVLRNANEIGSGRPLCLAFNVDTTFTCATFGATIEFQLISLPVTGDAALTDATSAGKEHFKTAVPSNTSADTMTIIGHELALGTPLWVDTASGAATVPADDTIYYVIPVTADTFQLATTLADALTGVSDVTINGANDTFTVHWIPTVHASSGGMVIYDTPSDIGPLQAGRRFHVPIRPLEGEVGNQVLAAGQTLTQAIGAGPGDVVAAAPNRYYYLNYVPSAAVTAGAVTCDIVLEGENAKNYYGSGFKVI